MKKNAILITLILALAVVFISGCITDDVTGLAKMNPIISQFLKEHPNADIDITHFSQSDFEQNKWVMLSYCNQNNAFITKTSIEPAEYYFFGITDKESNQYIIALINWDDRIIECAVKADASEIGVTEPPTQEIEPPTQEIEPPTQEIEPPIQEEIVQDAEKEFEEMVCNSLPENAVYGKDGLALQIPLNLESELSKIGGAIGFTHSNIYMKTDTETGERSYANGGWASSGFSNEHLMIIPITARLKESNGDIVTKSGGIKLTFTGQLQPYKMTITQQGAQPMVDGPGVKPAIPVQYSWSRAITPPTNPSCPAFATCEFESVLALSRTGCIVDFEKQCEQEEGYTLEGQCHYSDFIGDIEKNSDLVKNLGQCRYCPSGSKGTWGALGICGGGFNCISSGGGSSTTYYVSCSQCRTTPSTSSYRGESYQWCNYYYNACVQSGCGKILDNCR